MVSEGLANMVASDLPYLTKACAETRTEARRSAARAAPDLAKAGVIRAEPLSQGLFSQEATDRVFAAVPAIINIPQQQTRFVLSNLLFSQTIYST